MSDKYDNIILDDRDLVFFDTETTGLPPSAEIIEIGYVKAKAKTFEFLSEGDIKIKPSRIDLASPEALKINGYSEDEWAREGVGKTEGFTAFLRETKDAMLVGHNLAFDREHLEIELENLGMEPNYFYKGLDTFVLAWLLLRGKPELKKYSLSELAPYYGIDQGRAHRAIDDARTTYYVFKKLLEEYGKLI